MFLEDLALLQETLPGKGGRKKLVAVADSSRLSAFRVLISFFPPVLFFFAYERGRYVSASHSDDEAQKVRGPLVHLRRVIEQLSGQRSFQSGRTPSQHRSSYSLSF